MIKNHWYLTVANKTKILTIIFLEVFFNNFRLLGEGTRGVKILFYDSWREKERGKCNYFKRRDVEKKNSAKESHLQV